MALEGYRAHRTSTGALPFPTYNTREEAVAYAEDQIGRLGPYEVVDLSKPGSIQLGVDLLIIATGYSGQKEGSIASDAGSSRSGGGDVGESIVASDAESGRSDGGDVGENNGGVDLVDHSRDWFNRVFIPDVERQYIEKCKARDRGQPWIGRVFPDVDASVPDPDEDNMQNVREWLTRELLPIFEEQVREIQDTRGL